MVLAYLDAATFEMNFKDNKKAIPSKYVEMMRV